MTEPLHIAFDEAAHTYMVGGERWPSVTQVLAPIIDYSAVPADLLEAAAQFGKHVHAACHLDNLGNLDEDALDPALAPYLAGWRLFRKETGAAIRASEQIVAHAKLRYAGTLDTLVVARLRRSDALIDIKTGSAVPKHAGPQTAAYAEAMGLPRIARYVCHLVGAGKYRLVPLTDQRDWSVFLSCLNILRFNNGR